MTLNAKQSREQQRFLFLQKHGYPSKYHQFLAGDASPRQYYRWQHDGQSIILMDTPLAEKPEQFRDIANLLIEQGLSAPLILATDSRQGFLLLEDLGNQTYTRALTDTNTESLYLLAIDVLIHLHKNLTVQPDFIDSYTVQELLREATLLIDWYYPALYGHEISQASRTDYEQLWGKAFKDALRNQPNSLILRDYHVDNLILMEKRTGPRQCGLLDFQDALWGPISYDIVSLLEDARRDVPSSLKEKAWEKYIAAFPSLSLSTLRQAGAIISAGRHAKIIGVFTRLAVRDRKPSYLKHLPRVWRLLEASLKEAHLSDLIPWYQGHFPEWRLPHGY